MIWISTVTGYPVPEPPSVIYADSARSLFRIANGCDLPTRDEAVDRYCKDYDKDSNGFGQILALYDPVEKAIILKKDWTPDSIANRSMLVHELVHHLQYESGNISKFRCRGLIEKEAYDVQNKWLEPYGTNVQKELNIGPLFLFMATSCEEVGGWISSK